MPAYLVGSEARVHLSPEVKAELSDGDGENRHILSFSSIAGFLLALIEGRFSRTIVPSKFSRRVWWEQKAAKKAYRQYAQNISDNEGGYILKL